MGSRGSRYCPAEDEPSAAPALLLASMGTHLPFTSCSPSGQTGVFFGALEGSADEAFGSTEDDALGSADDAAALGSTDEDEAAGSSEDDGAVLALLNGAAFGAAEDDGSTELDETVSADELTGAAAEEDVASTELMADELGSTDDEVEVPADELTGALAIEEGCSLEAALEEGCPLADEARLEEASLDEAPLEAADDELSPDTDEDASPLLALELSPEEAELLASALDEPLPIWAVPVLPAVSTPGTWRRVAVPRSTTPTMASRTVAATSAVMAVRHGAALYRRTTSPSSSRISLRTCGVIITPMSIPGFSARIESRSNWPPRDIETLSAMKSLRFAVPSFSSVDAGDSPSL